MFLHIGGDYVVSMDEVIFIIDASLENSSPATKELIKAEKDKKKVVDLTDRNPKAYVITESQIFYSPISSGTLHKRGSLGKNLIKAGMGQQ